MEIAEIISPDRVAVESGITSKKAVLERLAELISATDPRLTTTMVFDSLIARERLGSTGLGMGVAIPHGRNNIQEAAVGACLLTREDVEFELDRLTVDTARRRRDPVGHLPGLEDRLHQALDVGLVLRGRLFASS